MKKKLLFALLAVTAVTSVQAMEFVEKIIKNPGNTSVVVGAVALAGMTGQVLINKFKNKKTFKESVKALFTGSKKAIALNSILGVIAVGGFVNAVCVHFSLENRISRIDAKRTKNANAIAQLQAIPVVQRSKDDEAQLATLLAKQAKLRMTKNTLQDKVTVLQD